MLDAQIYPIRLFILPEAGKRERQDYLQCMRRYSIPTLILMFFIFSFLGWFWEVGIHLIEDGVFVTLAADSAVQVQEVATVIPPFHSVMHIFQINRRKVLDHTTQNDCRHEHQSGITDYKGAYVEEIEHANL